MFKYREGSRGGISLELIVESGSLYEQRTVCAGARMQKAQLASQSAVQFYPVRVSPEPLAMQAAPLHVSPEPLAVPSVPLQVPPEPLDEDFLQCSGRQLWLLAVPLGAESLLVSSSSS